MKENVLFSFFEKNIWLLKLSFVILALLVSYFLLKRVVKIIKARSKSKWVEKIDYIVLKPCFLPTYINTTMNIITNHIM